MSSFDWEDEMFKSPKRFAPEVEYPSPERIAFEPDAFNSQNAHIQLNPQNMDFLHGQPDDDGFEVLKVCETGISKRTKRNLEIEEDDEDSSYHQSEELSEGSKLSKDQIPLNSKDRNLRKNKKIKKRNNKNSVKHQRRSNLRNRARKSIHQQMSSMKNLKSISKNVMSLINSMRSSATLSNDDLAKLLIDKPLKDSRQDKNIRRRLYDAVNVLEAVGKVNKTSRLQGKTPKNGSYTLVQPLKFEESQGLQLNDQSQDIARSEQSLKKERKLVQIQKRIQTKKRKLQQLIHQRQNLKKLLQRNQSHKQSANSRIYFPIMAFQIGENTKFSFTKDFFGYLGPLPNVHNQFNILSHLSLRTQNRSHKKPHY